jgi:hypothetical protein
MVLAGARDRYRERFDGEFFVLIWPRSRLDAALEEQLVRELERRAVPTVRVPAMTGREAEAYLHPLDSHPNAAETEWIARSLLERVALEAPP